MSWFSWFTVADSRGLDRNIGAFDLYLQDKSKMFIFKPGKKDVY